MLEFLTGETVRDLAGGLAVTLILTLVTSGLSVAIGVGVAGWRVSAKRRFRWPASTFIEVFRNVPALIQIIFWAFAVPNLVPAQSRPGVFFDNGVIDGLAAVTRLQLPYYALAAGLGLTLNTSAHLGDILRAGVGAVPANRVDSARTLGAGARTVYVAVILPSAIRTSFPAISTRLIHNMKNTALASFVAVPELFHEVQASITRTFRATEYLALAALLYLALSAILSLSLDRLDRRLQGWPAATID
ncbi:MAG: ABC transporter permease subunit [Acidimicrobiales bacterium]